jgi:hypothetical protein
MLRDAEARRAAVLERAGRLVNGQAERRAARGLRWGLLRGAAAELGGDPSRAAEAAAVAEADAVDAALGDTDRRLVAAAAAGVRGVLAEPSSPIAEAGRAAAASGLSARNREAEAASLAGRSSSLPKPRRSLSC